MINYFVWRFNGDYEIGFFNRLYFYPTFAIVILDCTYLSNGEKQEFKDTILKQWFSSRKYRKSLEGKYIIFARGKLQGVYNIQNLPGFNPSSEFYVDFPCVDRFVINSEKFPWY